MYKSLIQFLSMKKIISISLFFAILAFCQSLFAQINTGVLPKSAAMQLSESTVPQFNVKTPDLSKIQAKEDLALKNGTPMRAGIVIPLELNSNNSGIWETTDDGYDIWRLKLHNSDAKGCCVLFSKLSLPMGAEFFCYNEDKSLIYGPYTTEDVSGEEFSTGVFGEGDIILEYISPKHNLSQMSAPEISLFGYNFFFRSEGLPNLKVSKGDETGFEASQACMVNVNCPEGNNWRTQQKGVARMLAYFLEGGQEYSGWCSGTVVNNTLGDGTPYFLAANHCADNTPSNYWNYFQFYFHYECPYCNCNHVEPGYTLFSNGCTKVANSPIQGGSDFLLLKIKNVSWNQLKLKDIVLNGWSKSSTGSPSGVSIHHPAADVKKISTYNTTLTSGTFITQGATGATNAYWVVPWATTYDQGSAHHSVTEQGSSGSPIFNNNGLVVGTLTGGSSSCNYDAAEYYGKLSYHWQSAGSSSEKQLRPWLDPIPLSQTTCDYLDLNSSFYVLPAGHIFNASASNFTYSVFSNQAWTLTYQNDHSWFTVNNESGTGNGNIKVTCQANTGSARIGKLTVTKTDGSTFNLYVRQEAGASGISMIEESEFNIYPNPAHDQLNIESVNYFIKTVEIIDMLGKVVYSYSNSSANSLILPVSQLDNAMYIVRITTEDNGIVYKKFTKN